MFNKYSFVFIISNVLLIYSYLETSNLYLQFVSVLMFLLSLVMDGKTKYGSRRSVKKREMLVVLFWIAYLSVVLLFRAQGGGYIVGIQSLLILMGVIYVSLWMSENNLYRRFVELSLYAGILVSIYYLTSLQLGRFDFRIVDGMMKFGNVHVNLIAWFFVGYFCVALYACDFKKYSAIALMFLSFVCVYTTGSRGGLFSLIIGICFFGSLKLYSRFDKKRHPLRMIIFCSTMFVSAIFVIITTFIVLRNERVGFVLDINSYLNIESKGRGIDSGFSGRFETWEIMLDNPNLIDLLLGVGYRQSYLQFGFVDNSYIVLLWECGFFGVLMIIYVNYRSLLNILKWSCCDNDYIYRGYVVPYLVTIMIVMAGSVVARYYLSSGNFGGLFWIFTIVNTYKGKIFVNYDR